MPSEFAPIVKQLLASEDFYRAEQRTELFQYLWAHSPQYSPTELIWRDLLGPLRARRERTKNLTGIDWQRNTRASCMDLRDKLNEYFANVTEGWHVTLALGKRNVGYRLELFKVDGPDTPTMAFWRPHVDQKNVTLVYPQPMCYLDIGTGGYFRFLDTNPKFHTTEEALAEIEKRHSDELQKLYGTTARARLRPTHMYVPIGEVAALDALTTWFQTYPFVAVDKKASHAVTSPKGVSPILIGNRRTNNVIDKLMDSPDSQHLRYRLHDSKLGHVVIREPKSNEKPESLREIAAYPENGCTVIPVAPMALPAERKRLVILARMPNPVGPGPVTMISSETALAIEQMALALTTENNPQIVDILKALGWPERPLPASFEMVFSVRIAPGGFDDEAEAPQLLRASSY